MKRICTFLIGLLITTISFGQSIVGDYVPQYISTGATNFKVPYACRVTVNGLSPNTTYRCYNRFVGPADIGEGSISNGTGNYAIVKPSGAGFVRVTLPSLLTANRYIEFTTNASGSHTAWFIGETTTAAIFNNGNTVYFRLMINDGTDASSPTVGNVMYRLTLTNDPITVVGFGTTAAHGTAVRSTPAASGTVRNFVMLYDNTAGTGRPIAGTVIEGDSSQNTTGNGYARFYAGRVNEVDKTWGTIIPNNLANGIKKIIQYGLADGIKTGSKTSTTGLWAKDGGSTVNTVNPGGTDTLVLDGSLVPLGPPVGQTITFNGPLSKTYGDADFDPGATSTSGLQVIYTSSDPNVATVVNGNTIHITGAGTTTITAKQPGDDDFTAATDVSQTLTVGQANLTIKANKQFWVQGSNMPELTLTYTGFVNSDDSSDLNPPPNVTTTATATSPIGFYPIDVNGAGSPNYNIAYVSDTIFIVSNKQSQTINFPPLADRTYGDADFDAGATATSLLPITYTSSDPNVATINTVTNKIHIIRAGTTTITASQAGNNSYDPAQSISLLLTVNKAALTITVVDTSRLLGEDNPTFRLIYNGFVNGENNTQLLAQPVVTTTADLNSPAGKYPVKAKDAASDNYSFTYVDGELTIDPLSAQTIQFAVLPAKKYGDGDFQLDGKASSNLPVSYTSSNTNVATIENNMVHIVGAGTAVITASQSGNAAFAPARNVEQTLIVQKASLTIRANDYTKNEGEPNPVFSLTYSGFINGDDSTKLTSLPVMNTVATTGSVAGTYRIMVQGAASPNYTINQQNGILTVLPVQGEGQNNVVAYLSSPGLLQVNVYAVEAGKGGVQLFDGNGTRLVNTNVNINKGFNTFRVPVGNLTHGIYHVRVAFGSTLLKTKVIVH